MRSHDWATSRLGAPVDWPPALKTVAGLMLRSKAPVFLAWGPGLCLLYNDACLEILGQKHPAALGQPLYDVWPEARSAIEPLLNPAPGAQSVQLDSTSFLLHPVDVDGQAGLRFSCVPVDGPDSTVAGLYCTLVETGVKVPAEPPRQTETQRRQPGVRRKLLNCGAPVHDAQGKIIGSVAAQADITDQGQTESALRETIRRYHTIANAIPQIVWGTQPDGYLDYCNLQWYVYTGILPGGIDCHGWQERFHPEDRELALTKWRCCLATGEFYEMEHRLRHHSGQYRWVLVRARPVRNAQGVIVRWIGTCTDIHEQKLAQQGLEHADRLKDEFLAMLAHELRNPLAPIATAADLLSRGTLDASEVRQLSEVISRQARHMTRLTDDLLDVSRVTRGQVTLDKKPVDLKVIVTEALEQIRPLLAAKAHHLDVQLPPESTRVMGDRLRLVQVLVNVLGNAIRYTPDGGRIELRMLADDGHLTLCVRDNGIGMSSELLDMAFELFTQGERSSDRSLGGLGIGLALVRSLVHLHGGTARLQSGGTGLGSEVTVVLPRLRNEVEPRRAEADAAALCPAGNALRVLVVDDNADAARLLGRFLELLGHEVFVQFHPADAIECARRFLPHLCLLDIGLPDMDGYTLARQLRLIPGLETAVMAAVTGYSQPRDKQAAFAAGFNFHFAKPIDSNRLESWLVEVAEHARRQKVPAIAGA